MRGQCHAPAAPYPRERPATHCTGGWVGLRAGLDWCGKSRPTGIRSPDRPARRQLYLMFAKRLLLLQWLPVPGVVYCLKPDVWEQSFQVLLRGRTELIRKKKSSPASS